MRTVLVGEVRTGRRITQIPVADASWRDEHRGTSAITITVPLRADEFRALERSWVGGLYPGAGVFPSPTTYPLTATPLWAPGENIRPEFLAALDPARCFLAVLEDDRVLAAGPIWSHAYDDASGMLEVAAAGMESLFDHRLVMGVLSSGWSKWSKTYDERTLGTIAKELVQLAMTHTGGDLPIVFPADVSGGSEREYLGFEMQSLGDALRELQDDDGGPDIAFTPRLTADALGVEWVMRVGSPMLDQGAADDWVWDSRAPRGGVGGLSVRRDASSMAQYAWITGDGMDEALVIARRQPSQIDEPDLRNSGFPLMEVWESRPTVKRSATAAGHAAALLSGSLRPSMTWDLEVQALPTNGDGVPAGPQLGQYRPGDWAQVWVGRDHPYLSAVVPDGFHRARIVSVSGGLGDMVSLSLMPQMEVR